MKNIFGKNSHEVGKMFFFPMLIIFVMTVFGVLSVHANIEFWNTTYGNIVLALVVTFMMSVYYPIFRLNTHQKKDKNVNIEKINTYKEYIRYFFSLLVGTLWYFFFLKHYNREHYADQILFFGLYFLLFFGIFILLACIYRKAQKSIIPARSLYIKSIIFGILGGGIFNIALYLAKLEINSLFAIYIPHQYSQYITVISMIFIAGMLILYYYYGEIQNQKIGLLFSSRTRKILRYYIFLPLTIIYLGICVVYGMKILITGVWPQGTIVPMGIGYTVLGILTLFLGYDKQKENTGSTTVQTGILISFLLVAMMMTGALYQRILYHGMTINRYFVCAFVFVLSIYSLSALIFPKKKLLIASSLVFIISLISIYGPLSAIQISFNSQKSSLVSLLSENNIATPLGGNALKNINKDAQIEIFEKIKYLLFTYPLDKGIEGIIEIDTTCAQRSKRECQNNIQEYLGVADTRYHNKNDFRFIANTDGVDISGYNKIYDLKSIRQDIVVTKYTYMIDGNTHTLDFAPYIDELHTLAQDTSWDTPSATPFEIIRENKKFVILQISGQKSPYQSYIDEYNLEGYLLVK